MIETNSNPIRLFESLPPPPPQKKMASKVSEEAAARQYSQLHEKHLEYIFSMILKLLKVVWH